HLDQAEQVVDLVVLLRNLLGEARVALEEGRHAADELRLDEPRHHGEVLAQAFAQDASHGSGCPIRDRVVSRNGRGYPRPGRGPTATRSSDVFVAVERFQPISSSIRPLCSFCPAFSSSFTSLAGERWRERSPDSRLISPRLSPTASEVRYSAISSGDAIRANCTLFFAIVSPFRPSPRRRHRPWRGPWPASRRWRSRSSPSPSSRWLRSPSRGRRRGRR